MPMFNTQSDDVRVSIEVLCRMVGAGKSPSMDEVATMISQLKELRERVELEEASDDLEDRLMQQEVEALFDDCAEKIGAPDPAYLSRVPFEDYDEDYDTVLGYLAKHQPDALRFDAWDPQATVRDGYWLKHRCAEHRLEPIKVEAPAVLREQGIETVNAYPVSLLRERLG